MRRSVQQIADSGQETGGDGRGRTSGRKMDRVRHGAVFDVVLVTFCLCLRGPAVTLFAGTASVG